MYDTFVRTFGKTFPLHPKRNHVQHCQNGINQYVIIPDVGALLVIEINSFFEKNGLVKIFMCKTDIARL